LITRQALHAALLGFQHPIEQTPVEFQARLHDDMRRLVSLLRMRGVIEKPEVPGARIDLETMLSVGGSASG
jgi:hypothetical protein